MLLTIILAVSAAFQVTAAVQAIRLIKLTGWRSALLPIAAAAALSAGRRCVVSWTAISGADVGAPDLAAETLGLTQSAFVLIGITALRPLFVAAQRNERALRTIGECNRALVRAAAETELLESICRVVVEYGGRRMAWVGLAEHDDERRVRPVAQAGFDAGYLEQLNLTWAENERGHGPTGAAIRTGRPVVARNIPGDPAFAPWQAAAIQRGYASSIALPLSVGDTTIGALSIYAAEPDAFSAAEQKLLVELADNLSFGIAALRARWAREQAEQALRAERDFSVAVLDSLPGVLYCYDSDFKFLRWNKNFERVTGYSAAEIARMSPLDYFAGADQALVADRIREVFTTGASEVEADFVAKDGKRTPYYFTGLRTTLSHAQCLVGVGLDISRRRRVEQALRESEARFRAIASNTPDHVVMQDRALRYELVINPQLGLTAEEMLGKTDDDLLPPDEADQLTQLKTQVLATGQPLRVGLPLHSRSGEREYFEGAYVPRRDDAGNATGVIGYFRNVTERVRAEDALRESERRLSFALEQSHTGSWDLDLVDHTASCTLQQHRIFGYESLLPQWTYELFLEHLLPEDRDEVDRRFREAIATRTDWNFEYRIRRCDGAVRWIWAAGGYQPDPSGNPRRMIGIAQDITERKLAELEIRKLNAELEERVRERTAQLEAANRELEAFSYSVSHDLRAPLRAMDGFARILAEKCGPQLDSLGAHWLGRIRDNARQMGQLVDDLLAFSRLSRQAVQRQTLRIDNLAREVLAERSAEQHGQNIELSIAELPPCNADRALLKQVLANLLDNALKYTRGRDPARVELGALRHGAEQVYFVRDNGVGFDMRYAENLFGVFQRLHRAEEFEGTGVGLATVQRIVQRHGGRVWAESAPGQGATFYFTLEGGPADGNQAG